MIYDRVLRFGENVRAGNNRNKKRPCMIISHRVYFKLKGFLKLFTSGAGIRLHNISVFWGDHCVKLDNHRVMNHRSQTIGSRRRRRAELTGSHRGFGIVGSLRMSSQRYGAIRSNLGRFFLRIFSRWHPIKPKVECRNLLNYIPCHYTTKIQHILNRKTRK